MDEVITIFNYRMIYFMAALMESLDVNSKYLIG